jgi:hypothetical protein
MEIRRKSGMDWKVGGYEEERGLGKGRRGKEKGDMREKGKGKDITGKMKRRE